MPPRPSARPATIAATAALACALAATAATAIAGVPVIPQRFTMQNATADCQGALPSFEGALRKRPTGIVNEGGAAAFVTCSMQGEVRGSSNPITWFGIGISNRAAAPLTVSCTAVLGIAGDQQFLTKSVTVQPTGRADIMWSANGDNGGVGYNGPVNYSCGLVAGSEVSYTYRRFYIEE